MNHKDKNLLAQAGNIALATLITIWVLNFLLTRRVGGFLLLTVIGGFGSLLIVSGAINVISWNVFDSSYTAGGQWWIQVPCWIGSALFSALYMAYHGMWESAEEKCRKIDRETEGAD